MAKPIKRYRLYVDRDDVIDTKAFTIGLINMGTATAYIDELIPLIANATYVYPVIGPDHLYVEGLKISFSGEGTKKVLIMMSKPE